MTTSDLFPSRWSSKTGTSNFSRSSLDLDLREEFNTLLFGGGNEEPIGQSLILRRMRRVNGELEKCPCRTGSFASEAVQDYPCNFCQGVGYLWNEELVTGYKTVAVATNAGGADSNLQKKPIGDIYLPAIVFFFPYDLNPERNDIIVEINLKDDGSPITPYKRIGFYETYLVRDLRGEYGRRIYWSCNTRRIAPPTQGRSI